VLASATIVAVFLWFMGGIPGQFFNHLGDGRCFYHIFHPGGAYHDPNDRAYLPSQSAVVSPKWTRSSAAISTVSPVAEFCIEASADDYSDALAFLVV